MNQTLYVRQQLTYLPLGTGMAEARVGLASDRRGVYNDNGLLLAGQANFSSHYPDTTLQLGLSVQAIQAYITPRQSRLLSGRLSASSSSGPELS